MSSLSRPPGSDPARQGRLRRAGRDRVAWGAETDAAFVALAERLVALGAPHALATHDQALLERLLPLRSETAVECLLGVRPVDARRLAAEGRRVRVYVPYGGRWFRYAARRAAESIGV